METVRQQKVNRLLQKEISLLFQNEFSHLANGALVSITVVRVSPDLGYAKVFMSIFPSTEPQKMIDSYNAMLHEIQHQLYPKIRNQFRKMPELRFYYDDSLDYADRIENLLKP